uniref:TY-Chap central domain-containing protein n=2 Tax=Streptomyces TaxID=1883 RepID=A0AAU2A212_9ACTN
MSDFTDRLRADCFGWLHEQYSGVYVNGQGAIIVPFQRTVAFVDVEDKLAATGRVNVHAPVLVGMRLTPELAEHVALNGGNYLYGALSFYLEEGEPPALEFDYSMFGETVTEPVLKMAVALVAGTAETVQRELQPRFGGRSILDQCLD